MAECGGVVALWDELLRLPVHGEVRGVDLSK